MTLPKLTPTQRISLRESYSAGIDANTRVDFERGIVFDVELLGPDSKNRRKYTPEFIREAYKEVEKHGSYIDHPPGESNSRSIKERFGKFVGPYINKHGRLCAREYHYDKNNSFAKSFEWQLRNCPQEIGFSINADAGGYEENGEVIVTRLFECHGFDLVDRPATTNGIFAVRESLNRKSQTLTIREATMFPEAFNVGMKELGDGIASGSIDIATAKKKMGDLLKLIDPGTGDKTTPMPEATDVVVDAVENEMEGMPEDEQEMKVMEACSKSKKKAIRFLASRLDAYRVREQAEKVAKEKEKITIARIDRAKKKFGDRADTLITGVFREQLASVANEADADKLIDDRFAVFNVRETTASGTRFEEPISAPTGQSDEVKQVVAKMFG